MLSLEGPFPSLGSDTEKTISTAVAAAGACATADPPAQPTDCKFLLGHISLITDMQLTHMGKQQFLLTADRDEKIRVSRFPEAYEIQSFCHGHTEYAPFSSPSLLFSSLCSRLFFHLLTATDRNHKTREFREEATAYLRGKNKEVSVSSLSLSVSPSLLCSALLCSFLLFLIQFTLMPLKRPAGV